MFKEESINRERIKIEYCEYNEERGRGCLLLLLNYGNHYLITYNGIQLYVPPPATGGEDRVSGW